MNVYITSFYRSHGIDAEKWSAAVYQPKGYAYPKADWCDIRRDGAWIRPRNYAGEVEPLKHYREDLLELYRERVQIIEAWLAARGGYDVCLCCWCPYDQAAQRQLQTHGSFVCHTAVIGEVLEELGQRVWYDADRRKMVHLDA